MSPEREKQLLDEALKLGEALAAEYYANRASEKIDDAKRQVADALSISGGGDGDGVVCRVRREIACLVAGPARQGPVGDLAEAIMSVITREMGPMIEQAESPPLATSVSALADVGVHLDAIRYSADKGRNREALCRELWLYQDVLCLAANNIRTADDLALIARAALNAGHIRFPRPDPVEDYEHPG